MTQTSNASSPSSASPASNEGTASSSSQDISRIHVAPIDESSPSLNTMNQCTTLSSTTDQAIDSHHTSIHQNDASSSTLLSYSNKNGFDDVSSTTNKIHSANPTPSNAKVPQTNRPTTASITEDVATTTTTTATTTSKETTTSPVPVPVPVPVPSPYEELKIHGPPLYSQTTLSHDFTNEYNDSSSSDENDEGITLHPSHSNPSTVDQQPKTKRSKPSTSAKKLSNHPVPFDADTTALLVVDVQPEYWSQCPAVRKDFPEFPDAMNRLLQTARQKRTKVIWIRADYRYSHSPWLVQFARLHKHHNSIPEEVHCGGPTTAEWEDFATPLGGEFVIPKTSWCSTSHTSLIDLLRQSGINTVLVCGLITSVCVQHSAFGIFEAGYRTILVTDACADRGRARHDAALALYGDYMYELITTKELEDPQRLRPAQPVWLGYDNKDTATPTNRRVLMTEAPRNLSKTTTAPSTVTTTGNVTSNVVASILSVSSDGCNTFNDHRKRKRKAGTTEADEQVVPPSTTMSGHIKRNCSSNNLTHKVPGDGGESMTSITSTASSLTALSSSSGGGTGPQNMDRIRLVR